MLGRVGAVADLVTIVAGLLLCFTLLLNRSASTSDIVREQRADYARGAELPRSAPIDYTGANRTVILFLNTHCPFCTRSLDFYRDLAAVAESWPDRLSLVVVTTERPDAVEGYVREHHVAGALVVSLTESRMTLSATPTLLIATQRRVVVGSWRGQLTTPQQRRVFATLGTEATETADPAVSRHGR